MKTTLINRILSLYNFQIEMIGSWLWIKNINNKEIAIQLKKFGFFYSTKRNQWFLKMNFIEQMDCSLYLSYCQTSII